MRVLFTPLASASHYYPMVPLAWACRAAGHEVRVAAQPPIIGPIIDSGMTPVQVGGSYDLLAELRKADELIIAETGRGLGYFKDFADMPPDTLRRYLSIRRNALVKTAEAMSEDLAPFIAAWRPDLVITDPPTLAGPLAAELSDAFLLAHSWGTQVPPQRVPEFGAFMKELTTSIQELYSRFGLQPSGSAGHRMIIPCPPSLINTRLESSLLTRYVPYNGSGIAPGWLKESTDLPRICISWSLFTEGTAGWDSNHLSALVEALANLKAEIIVTTGLSTTPDLKSFSDRVRVVNLLPLQMILPSSVVAISHGGCGSMLTAVSYGVPQILLPQQQEQIMNSELIASTGAGTWFSTNNFDPELIAEAVSAMISEDKWSRSARDLQLENAALPAPSRVVETIEDLMSAR